MKLNILKDHDLELGPNEIKAFKVRKDLEVPDSQADALLKLEGVAERANPATTSAKVDKNQAGAK